MNIQEIAEHLLEKKGITFERIHSQPVRPTGLKIRFVNCKPRHKMLTPLAIQEAINGLNLALTRYNRNDTVLFYEATYRKFQEHENITIQPRVLNTRNNK